MNPTITVGDTGALSVSEIVPAQKAGKAPYILGGGALLGYFLLKGGKGALLGAVIGAIANVVIYDKAQTNSDGPAK